LRSASRGQRRRISEATKRGTLSAVNVVQYNLNMNGSQAVSGFNTHSNQNLRNDSEFILIQQRMRMFLWYFGN
jgi:hypothetical protein